MDKNSLIYIAGHRGMVGSAMVRALQKNGYHNLLYTNHAQLDLCRQTQVENFFSQHKPEYVVLAAARVGGIYANSHYPAEFIYENLQIATNIIETSKNNGVKKLINLGSSCIYPRLATQPLKEESLLSGFLEPTNEAYAVAKIAAIKLCRYYNEQYNTNFLSVMPPNLYGQGDNFDLKSSHFLAALVRKITEAKINKKTSVTLWGDGSPFRELLHVDDLARAIIVLLEHGHKKDYGEIINIGSGQEHSIADIAKRIARLLGYEGQFIWNTSMPNGTPRKILNSEHFRQLSNWTPQVSLDNGIVALQQEYLSLCKEKNS